VKLTSLMFLVVEGGRLVRPQQWPMLCGSVNQPPGTCHMPSLLS